MPIIRHVMNLYIEHRPKLRSRCLLFQPHNKIIIISDASVSDNAKSELKRIVTYIHGTLPPSAQLTVSRPSPDPSTHTRAAIYILLFFA